MKRGESMSRMLSCKDLLEELGDYLDDDVSATLRRELETSGGLPAVQGRGGLGQADRENRHECRSFELPPKFTQNHARIRTGAPAARPGGRT